jgi:peptidoglycan hydrolase CwlO-like protein
MTDDTANQVIEILIEKINDLTMEIERSHEKIKQLEFGIVELTKSCISERQVY